MEREHNVLPIWTVYLKKSKQLSCHIEKEDVLVCWGGGHRSNRDGLIVVYCGGQHRVAFGRGRAASPSEKIRRFQEGERRQTERWTETEVACSPKLGVKCLQYFGHTHTHTL